MARPTARLTGRAEAMIRLDARGTDPNEIMRIIFDIDPGTVDPKLKNKLAQQMFRWRHHPQAQSIWEDEVRQFVRANVPRAVNRINRQVDDDNGWLANKAANDMVNMAKVTGVFQTEDKAVRVQIEGMPELGSPDDEA